MYWCVTCDTNISFFNKGVTTQKLKLAAGTLLKEKDRSDVRVVLTDGDKAHVFAPPVLESIAERVKECTV